MNRHQLIDAAAIRSGETAAFAQLFEENRDRLLALAYRLTASRSDAEDVVQDAFVSSWRNHAQFQGQSKPSTWLYRVTFNAALMRLRTKRRKGADSLDALAAEVADSAMHAASSLDDTRSTVPDPETQAARGLVREALDDALAGLKEIDRQIVRLRFCDGLSTEEVAGVTGLSASAVKTRLHRARAVLRECIEGDARVAA